MPLNIKDETVHAKARRLADLTGESITDAVADAIERRLKEIECNRVSETEQKHRLEAMREIAHRFASSLPPGHGATSTDHGDFLYDEDGLPK